MGNLRAPNDQAHKRQRGQSLVCGFVDVAADTISPLVLQLQPSSKGRNALEATGFSRVVLQLRPSKKRSECPGHHRL
jgi:hypothetical protein